MSQQKKTANIINSNDCFTDLQDKDGLNQWFNHMHVILPFPNLT